MAGAKRGRGKLRTEPSYDPTALGKVLTRLRVRAKLTYHALVESAGISRGSLSKIARGVMSPTLGMLYRLAVPLKVDVVDLVATGTAPRHRLVQASRGKSDEAIEAAIAVLEGRA